MKEYPESLRELMKLFGEDIEPGMSYEHIHKVIEDNLYNLKELNDKLKEVEKVYKLKLFHSFNYFDHAKFVNDVNNFMNSDSIELIYTKYDIGHVYTALIIYKVEGNKNENE